MSDIRYSDYDVSKRDIPSFIEPRPPLIQNPFMRPKPQKGTNLLELFEEDSEIEEPELVQVYLRLKPTKIPSTLYEVRSERCLVTSLDTATAGHGRRTQHNVSKMYTFSKIFDAGCNQKEIFEEVVKDNLKKLPEGHNFTLLTYGASGSGKTYTLMGTVDSPGLVPRSLEYVFRLVDAAQLPAYKPAENGAEKLGYAQQDFELQWVKRLRHVSAPHRDKYRRMSVQLHTDLTISSIDLTSRIRHYVWVSFVEIYNEAIYDLLSPPEKRMKLRIREDSSGNVYVKGATQAFVRSSEEAYDVMVAGKHNLMVAATGVHAHSSRSHCIFTITMLTETGDGGVRTSCIRLCDLAGCERARATGNTGARMQESRAINSSLLVLQRCLHMLRRKQKTRNDALVPYRESKLTRLLGPGFSGARGEAMSMMVTLNPAPAYAHESKHVLSLAVVAQDIQVNFTMLGSTLESSTQDTTINCSNEVMKLRADNERLHFEVVQAQARNKELMAAMDERQQEAATTMMELVEEAKDMTRQYYEAQLKALKSEMEDMAEEYESRLAKLSKECSANAEGTPSRFLQAKVAQLMTKIALLEEELTTERLARELAEKEVERLRAFIEESDGKAYKEVITLSDHEADSDEDISDPFNESLEPIFKKEELNKSIAKVMNNSVHAVDNVDEDDDDSDYEKSNDSLKADDSKNSNATAIEDNDSVISEKDVTIQNDSKTDVNDHNDSTNETYETTKDDSVGCNESVKNDTANMTQDKTHNMDVIDDTKKNPVKSDFVCRGTYFISDNKSNDNNDLSRDIQVKTTNSLRGTYFVDTSALNTTLNIESNDRDMTIEVFKEPVIEKSTAKVAKKPCETLVSKIIRSLKSSQSSDSSLRQFEQLEIESKQCDDNDEKRMSVFNDIKMLKEKRNYFDSEPATAIKVNKNEIPKEKRTYFDNIGVNVEVSNKKINEIQKTDEELSPLILKEKVDSDDFEPSRIIKIMGERFTKPEARLLKESVDIFESPVIINEKEKIDNIEIARQSIEKLVLDQQSAKKGAKLNVDFKSCTKVDNSKSVVTVSAQSPIKNNVAELSLRKDVTKYINKSPMRSEITLLSTTKDNVKSPIKQDIIKTTRQHDDKSPMRNEIPLLPTTKDNVQSPIKQDIAKTTRQHNDKSPIRKDTDKTPTKYEHVTLIKDAIKSTVKDHAKLPWTKDNDVISTKKDNDKSHIKEDKVKPQIKNHDAIPLVNNTKDIGIIDQPTEKEEIKLETVSSIEEKPTIPDIKTEPILTKDEPNKTIGANKTSDNTIEEFENIYKDITAPRATEFELLVESQSINENIEKTETKYNLRKKHSKTDDLKIEKRETENGDEILLESHAKSEYKPRKRTLRLKRKKNQGDEENEAKLKDIANLQTEFSDLTMDVPAPPKVVLDIPSPEKGCEENLPPIPGIQSCPAKSITRSRRKLFTPRAEPLEESTSHTGDSNERIYVPRPSYHRPRARRKL